MRLVFKTIIGFLALVGAVTIAGLTYLYVADPLGLKPLLMNKNGAAPAATSTNNTNTPAHHLLTPNQAAALQQLGLDPARLPTTITPATAACFTEALGEARVKDIMAGAAPTPLDLFRAKHCL